MHYKVFQWGTGSVGKQAARTTLQRDSLELVGIHAHSPQKIGMDIGELAGLPETGTKATGDIEAVMASEADIVIHAPLPSMVYGENPEQDLEDFCKLLASGKNVITLVGYMYPKVYGPEVVQRLEDACRKGNSSFHGTGLNPGWLGDLIPLTMSSLCKRVDHVHVLEISSFEFYPSPEIMFDSMGFNSEPDAFEASNTRRARWLNGVFSESVQIVADGMNLNVTEVVSQQELALAGQDLETASGIVRKGTVAGQHWRWSGITADGDERVVHETVWRMHSSVAPDWPEGKHAIRFKGSPGMTLEFEADFRWITDSFMATAMHAVNAIPYVVGAAPGIRTFLDLPWIMYRHQLAPTEQRRMGETNPA